MTSQAPTQGPTDAGLTARVLFSEWQPIETAPKDGTHILVCGPHNNGSQYMDVCGWPKNWTSKWPVAYMAYAAGEPTHWMPLPTPPTNPKGAA